MSNNTMLAPSGKRMWKPFCVKRNRPCGGMHLLQGVLVADACQEIQAHGWREKAIFWRDNWKEPGGFSCIGSQLVICRPHFKIAQWEATSGIPLPKLFSLLQTHGDSPVGLSWNPVSFP